MSAYSECSVAGCEIKTSAKGMCNKHYLRWAFAEGYEQAYMRGYQSGYDSASERAKEEGKANVAPKDYVNLAVTE